MARSNSKAMRRKNRSSSKVVDKDLSVLYREPRLRVHRFSRMVSYGQIAQSAADQGIGYGISLNNLQGVTDFTNLFNQYRITSVDVEYVLQTQVITGSYPRLIFNVDYNDATVPLTESDLLQYENASVCNFSQIKTVYKRSFKPRIALAAYQPSAFTAYTTAPPDTWVDSDNPSVLHYGWKHWLTNYNSTSTPTIKIYLYFRVHFECRGER